MKRKTALDKFIKDYNREDTVAIITPYPVIKDGVKTNVSGIDVYSYHMTPSMSSLLNNLDRKMIIVCDTKPGQETQIDNNGVLILPVWKRNSIKSYFDIIASIRKFNKVSKIFIHFDFNVYGTMLVSGLFPLLLFCLRKRNVTLLSHSVAESITSLSGHLGIKSKIKMVLLDFMHRTFHVFLLNLPKKVVVHDQLLRDRLLKIGKKPVFVVPHGLGEFKENCAVLNSRDYLNYKKSDFIVLCFGFLTWYKGSDWIIDKFADFYKKTGASNIHLLMAGGPSANLKDQEFYKIYYNKLVEKIKPYKNIRITGFIPDSEVPHCYCAANVVVLPYRTQMSASGPFAVAMAFDRPFLLSKNLEGVLETHDIKAKMGSLNISKNEILFSMENNDLFKKIVNLQGNKKELTKLANFSSEVAEMRDWSKISEKFLMVIDA